jgi:outer membrane biosynthesis protein TonB
MTLNAISKSRALAIVLLGAPAIALAANASARDQTVFPKASRTLTVTKPPQCNEWKAPLPKQRVNVVFPDDAKGLKGDAAVLVRIGAEGEYLGLVDALASEDTFARAAENSVKQWSFTPASCNGTPIASDARVDFKFQREDGVVYKTGGYLSKQ